MQIKVLMQVKKISEAMMEAEDTKLSSRRPDGLRGIIVEPERIRIRHDAIKSGTTRQTS